MVENANREREGEKMNKTRLAIGGFAVLGMVVLSNLGLFEKNVWAGDRRKAVEEVEAKRAKKDKEHREDIHRHLSQRERDGEAGKNSGSRPASPSSPSH